MFLYLSYLRENTVSGRMPTILSQMNENRFDTLVEVTEEEDNLIEEETLTDEESLKEGDNLREGDNLIERDNLIVKDQFIEDDISLLETDISDEEVVITEIKRIHKNVLANMN